jgi:ankyrin repeat protein
MTDLEKIIEAIQQGQVDRVRKILDADAGLVNQRDESGATPLHYATLAGQRKVVQLLLERGANINSTDGRFGATPTGWAIEYLREMGGFLGIELSDLAYAIQTGDNRWVARFLQRFPSLREMSDTNGTLFRELARSPGNEEIAKLFGIDDSAG